MSRALALARRLALPLALALAPTAAATLVIEQVFSTADGEVQFVVLRESQGADNDHLLRGQGLAVTHARVTKIYTYDHDLPSAATANKRVLLATPAFARLGIATPDYLLPARFLPTDGGILVHSGVDRVVLDPLPTDGVTAHFRDTGPGPNLATNFAGQSGSVRAASVGVIEYRHAGLDHYFVSPLAPDLDALDTGRLSGWARTGYAFAAQPAPQASLQPVCRFLIPPDKGDSHFLSASPSECQAVAARIATDPNYAGYVYETPAAFFMALPNTATGACPAGTIAVYRLWNGRADSNHRYTTEAAVKAAMQAQGYVAEGYGPDAVAMCAPGAAVAEQPVRVSGASPFAPGCEGFPPDGTHYPGAEVEPYLAVNPREPANLVAVWQQDRWSSGGASGLATAASFDGGRTWSRSTVPFSRCAGGTLANGGNYQRASDPWVTFAPDGTAHQVALAISGNTFQAGSQSAILASRSTDGGRTWSGPRTLIVDGPGFFNDKEAITADPADARYVYVVWDRLVATGGGPAYFARTSDGGLTWESARPVFDPGPTSQTIDNQIVVLPDGTLVLFFIRIDALPNNPQASTLQLLRSADKGATWSAPITIATAQSIGTTDPTTGAPIRDGTLTPPIAVGRNGHLAVAWQDARFSGGARDAIAFSRSTDGGLTWSAPVRINSDPGVKAFVPSVAISEAGTYGVAYFDFRSDTADPTSLYTDYWLTTSSDGVTWQEQRVAGPFDLAVAPVARGYFVGDYMGLVAVGAKFVPLFAQTQSGDAASRTDVFSGLAPAAGGHFAAKEAGFAPGGNVVATLERAPTASPLPDTPEWRAKVGGNVARALARRVPGWSPAGYAGAAAAGALPGE